MPACSSRPFALVGTLTVRFPWADLSGRMPSEVTMQKMQIFMGNNLEQNAVGAPDMYYMILNSINETLNNGHSCSRTPHKQGSLVFPPVVRVFVARATCIGYSNSVSGRQESRDSM